MPAAAKHLHAWILRQLCEYMGLPRRGRFMVLLRPVGPLIAPNRPPYVRDFTARGATLAWARQLEAVLRVEDAPRHADARGRLRRVLRDVAFGRWARYGYINGDLGNDTLDEPQRVPGSALNRQWQDVVRAARGLLPNADYVRACAGVACSICYRGRSLGAAG